MEFVIYGVYNLRVHNIYCFLVVSTLISPSLQLHASLRHQDFIKTCITCL